MADGETERVPKKEIKECFLFFFFFNFILYFRRWNVAGGVFEAGLALV